jgi:hypothetical protein
MKKYRFLMVALAVSSAFAIFASKKAEASSTFPMCVYSPGDFCETGPGGTEIWVDYRPRI